HYSPRHLLVLHSFPTRRSSDLYCHNAEFYNCRLEGYQDTLCTGPLPDYQGDGTLFNTVPLKYKLTYCKQSYENCFISGTVLNRRSEEHTSELQSRFDLVCRLLL